MDSASDSLGPVALPLTALFLLQALITSCAYSISVIAPDAAQDLGLSPNSVGFLASMLYLVAMFAGLASQSFISRFGATRTFQGLATLAALGCVALIASHPMLAFIGAALIGLGAGPMNPVGSHVLSRITPATWQPFVFSLKQCATPAGGMIAGALLPPLALLYDWRLALSILPAAALVLVVTAPYGKLDDNNLLHRHAPSRPIAVEVMASLRDAFASPSLRSVVLMGFFLGTCQLGIAAYFVVYLWSEAGMTPTRAGQVFVLFHVAGIATRILLGAVAQRHVPTRVLLPALGILMAAATAFASSFHALSPWWWIVLVTIGLGAGGNGWVGLFFAELVRLAPKNTASVAGGAQVLMFIGTFLGPLIYGVILKSGLSHQHCLWAFAFIALLTAAMPFLSRGQVVDGR